MGSSRKPRLSLNAVLSEESFPYIYQTTVPNNYRKKTAKKETTDTSICEFSWKISEPEEGYEGSFADNGTVCRSRTSVRMICGQETVIDCRKYLKSPYSHHSPGQVKFSTPNALIRSSVCVCLVFSGTTQTEMISSLKPTPALILRFE